MMDAGGGDVALGKTWSLVVVPCLGCCKKRRGKHLVSIVERLSSSCLVGYGMVWYGRIWSGLVWSGLVWLSFCCVSVCVALVPLMLIRPLTTYGVQYEDMLSRQSGNNAAWCWWFLPCLPSPTRMKSGLVQQPWRRTAKSCRTSTCIYVPRLQSHPHPQPQFFRTAPNVASSSPLFPSSFPPCC